MVYSLTGGKCRRPNGAGAGWPGTIGYWLGSAGNLGPVCPQWGRLFIGPGVYAISGGWWSGRIGINSGTFNGYCAERTDCGNTDPYVRWNTRTVTGGRGVHVAVWDALIAGLWSSSVAFTIHKTNFGSGAGTGYVQHRHTCSISPGASAGCYDGPAAVAFSFPSGSASDDPCVASLPTNTVTVYDDGSFTVA